MRILFFLVFALEMGAAFTIADKIADKLNHKYTHKPIYNILGIIGTILFFILSFSISYNAWIVTNIPVIIIGFIMLCISFTALTFIQKDYTGPKT